MAIVAVGAFSLATAAIAQAPVTPRGNFGGGALAAPPKDIFGPGNAVVALRALPARRLEIEATVRGRCSGGDITATTKVTANGAFQAKGTATQEPNPALRIRTHYTLSGRFTDTESAAGSISATMERSIQGRKETCRTGRLQFATRRPTSGIGRPGAPKAAHFYGTTSQRSTGMFVGSGSVFTSSTTFSLRRSFG